MLLDILEAVVDLLSSGILALIVKIFRGIARLFVRLWLGVMTLGQRAGAGQESGRRRGGP